LKDGYISTKEDMDDYSTIEGKSDSPLSMKGSAEVSSRFYRINYHSRDKEYVNTVISLMAYTHVPLLVIRYFGSSDTLLKRSLLKLFVRSYTIAARVKHALTSHATAC
jgi:hypothetical protein